ncbi:replication factor-A C terminal domain-containing protein, putative [Eimeria acervulina]|uniref:Replication factor-A C terminal domain-containing protein, putative n=1 Tax=Eimeria acervulina TaxID=5801 RepID=U6GV48_EIMAC|nr:replication factor-A C terminal domain-containing protein, putative [Eimeria acervulina]CDI83163.1 replication factor-A C terminal domain-containing protein, putative [Eimeria acervulina]
MLDSGGPPSERFLSISSLNPYVHRWQIKARVVDKSPLQTTKNNSKFFHVDVTDSAGDLIRAKFWGDAAEKWHGALEKGKVYCFCRGRVNVANKRFSTLSNNYELSFSAEADIKPAEDDGLCSMPLRNIFNSTRECPFPTDVLAVVVEVQPISSVTARSSGEELKRRVLKVRDKSQMEMEISLWGEQVDCITETTALPQVYGLTALNIRDWRGARSASTTKSSQILKAGAGLLSAEEETSAAEMLQWYITTGSTLSFLSMSRGGPLGDGAPSERKPVQELGIKEIKDKNEPGIYAFVAQVRRVYWKPRQQQQQQQQGQQQQDIYTYAACPSCDARLEVYAACLFYRQYRLFELQMLCRYGVTVKAEFDNYNGEQRMRYTALRVETLDPHGFSLLLLQHLKAAVRCLALLLLLMLSFAGVAVDTVTAASWHSVQMYEPLRPVDPTIVISIAQVPTLTDFAASKKARLEADDTELQPDTKRPLVEAH